LRWQSRVGLENNLKSVYRWLEDQQRLEQRTHPLADWAKETDKSAGKAHRALRGLQRAGFAEVQGSAFLLTDAGMKTARRIVRSHRLWELYLTRRASFATDHVHEDAEKMEHLMSEENLLHLENLLGWPETDPHGRPIPREPDARPPTPATA
jgi:manganese/zinc/iron transport system permease protein